MIFSYWSEEDTSAVASTIEAWSEHFSDYRMIGDGDVRPILGRMWPGFVELYDRIAIPACRSDLARLAYLHAHGGLYVDCHCHPADPEKIRCLLQGLDVHEVIFMSKDRARSKKPEIRDTFWPRNGVIFARKSSPIIARLLSAAVDNLTQVAAGQPSNLPDACQDSMPPAQQDIWEMTGPGLYISTLADGPVWPTRIASAYRDRIKLIEEADAPIRLYVHKSYRKRALHWSTRQASEPLFKPV